MSQRPVDSHDEWNPGNDGRKITLPPVDTCQGDDIPQAQRREAVSSNAPAPLSGENYAQQASTTYPPMQATDERPVLPPPRSVDVHNILNPTEPEEVNPRPSLPGLPPLAVVAAGQAQHESKPASRPTTRQNRGLQSPSVSSNERSDQLRPRKTLFPKSPRSMSLGGSGTGVFLQSTKQQAGSGATTSSTATAYSAMPGTYASGSTTHPPPSQIGYNFHPPVSTPPLDRRRSAGTAGPSGLSQSQTTSPSSSFFAYSSQPPPAQQYPRAQGPFTPGPGHFQPMGSQNLGGLRPSQPPVTLQQQEGPYMPPMPGGHLSMPAQGLSVGGHSMAGMHGGRISVPLDRVSGSRSADEKRKHNAAASSRFRERRKKLNDELKKENEEYARETKELKQSLEEMGRRLEETGRELNFYRDAYNRSIAAGGVSVQHPQPAPTPYHPQAYGHPPARVDRRPYDDEERPAQRRRTQGPEQGEAYTLPPATNYPPSIGYPPRTEEGGPSRGLQPPRSAPGSMSAPSPIPRSPFEQYRPATNGGGYFRGQHSGPPTPGPSQTGFSSQPPPPGAQGGERR